MGSDKVWAQGLISLRNLTIKKNLVDHIAMDFQNYCNNLVSAKKEKLQNMFPVKYKNKEEKIKTIKNQEKKIMSKLRQKKLARWSLHNK